MQEVWLPVVGYEGLYEVSDHGRVRSVDRVVTHSRNRFNSTGYQWHRKGQVLKPHPAGAYGYPSVCLHRGKVQKTRHIHQLVAEAFLGSRPEGMCVTHGSKGRTCNELSNLSYGTLSQNAQDRVRDGTVQRGSRNTKALLTEEAVLLIYSAETGYGVNVELAKRFGVTTSAIKSIRQGKSWGWLTKPDLIN